MCHPLFTFPFPYQSFIPDWQDEQVLKNIINGDLFKTLDSLTETIQTFTWLKVPCH